MLTLKDKKHLYQILSEGFPFEEAQPLAKVALYLSQHGIKSKDYGYKKVKAMFYDLAEFLTVKEILCGSNPQQELVLHHWEEKKKRGKHIESSPKQYRENDEDDFYRLVEFPNEKETEFIKASGFTREKARNYFSQGYETAKTDGTLKVEADRMLFATDLADVTLNRSPELEGKPWQLSFVLKKEDAAASIQRHGESQQKAEVFCGEIQNGEKERKSKWVDSEFSSLVNTPVKTLAAYAAMTGTEPDEVYRCLSEAYDRAKAEGKITVSPDEMSFETEHAVIYLKKSWYEHSGNPWHFSFSMKGQGVPAPDTVSGNKSAGNAGIPTTERTSFLNGEEKRQIYEDLTEVLPKEEKLHMAAVSKALNDIGHTRERYGVSKMKQLLQQLSEFMTLEDAVLGGVQQTLVTLHDVPVWDGLPSADLEKKTASERKNAVVNKIDKLPPVLDGYVQMVPKTLYKLNLAITGTEGEPSEEIMEMLRKSYEKARQTGDFFCQNDGYTFEVEAPSAYGGIVIVSIKRTDFGEYPWYLNFAGTKYHSGQNTSTPGRVLEQFAFLGSWNSFLGELAKKALPEPWDFENSTGKRYYILQKYIQYTFYRLQLEDKVCISDDERFAAFNTGLVTPHYDDIYACFESSDDAGYSTKWRFLEFCTAAGRGVGKRLVDYFSPLPQPASYFEKKEDLLFDLEKELHTDYEHILLDNISRFPIGFLREECYGMNEALDCIERIEQASDRNIRKKRYREFSDLIADTPRLFNRLRNRLEDAVDLARKQVRWNFKTAIPCFFPTRNVMSLMLPLSLRDDGQADIALVVEPTRSGNYQGQTILTLQQAYLDGRLLCRPNSEWLDTKNIGGDDDDDDEES